MTGFVPKRSVYRLDFTGTDLDGLEVRARACTVGELGGILSDEDTSTEEVISLFLSHVVSWNIETEDGTPIPTTREGLDSLELNVATQIMGAWQQAMVSVPPPLNMRSPNGATLVEQSLRLASESINPAS